MPDSGFVIEADAVISAIGQDPDLAPFGTGLAARRGEAVAPTARVDGEIVPLAAISLHYHPTRARAAERCLPVAERLTPAAQRLEVQLGLEVAQALAEAERCFSCGTCIHCDNCVTYCPDLAVRRAGDGYEVLSDYCKGCGVCVRECPTGSMRMQQEQR